MKTKFIEDISNLLLFLNNYIPQLMRYIFALVFLMFLSLSSVLKAQIIESDDFQKGKKIVSIPVAVNDREGHYIPDLKKGDFAVYQDGIKQKITLFETYDEPLSIALLIDTSGSTQEDLVKIKDAAKDFIELMNPADQCLLATFDTKVNIISPFSSNRKELKKSLDKIRTAEEDGTILRNAVTQISQNSFTNVQGRKVVVLLSDGKDIGSSVTRDELMNQLEESDVLIYTIFYKTGIGFKKILISSEGFVTEGKKVKKTKVKKIKKYKGYAVTIPEQEDIPTDEQIKLREAAADVDGVNILRALSETTAGRFYLSTSPKLNDTFKQIAGELRQQYRLGYRLTDTVNDAAVHNIVVKVERADAVVQTRGKFRAKQL